MRTHADCLGALLDEPVVRSGRPISGEMQVGMERGGGTPHWAVSPRLPPPDYSPDAPGSGQRGGGPIPPHTSAWSPSRARGRSVSKAPTQARMSQSQELPATNQSSVQHAQVTHTDTTLSLLHNHARTRERERIRRWMLASMKWHSSNIQVVPSVDLPNDYLANPQA